MATNNKTNITHSLKDEHEPQEGDHDETAAYLESLVEGSKDDHNSHVGVQSNIGEVKNHKTSLLSGLKNKFKPNEKKLDDRFVRNHWGNNVAIRGSSEIFFEPMPIYVRVGMHLLFYGSKKTSLLRWGKVENLLKSMSEKEGHTYDEENPVAVQAFIKSFIATYSSKYMSCKERRSET